MEFTSLQDFYSNFANQFTFGNAHLLEDFLDNFDEIMPQIEFNGNESLLDTFKKYYSVIGSHSTAYGYTYHPYYLFDFIKDPGNFHNKHFDFIENTLRHQGSLYTQTYYWIIFMIEILSRESDAISLDSARIPLKFQIYYENYIFRPILSNYIDGARPEFIYNTRPPSKFNENSGGKELEMLKDKVGKKIITLVKFHFCRLKDKLIDKCMKEEITPTRALWLTLVPLTYEELFNIITTIENKYIRSSLFFVAGFQKISKIRELTKNIIEKNAFDVGFEAIECSEYRYEQLTYYDDNNFEFKQYSKDGISKFNEFIFRDKKEKDKFSKKFNKMRTFKITNEDCELFNKHHNTAFETFFSFYPFLIYGNVLIKNWTVGCSGYLGLTEELYSNVAEEYKNYYKNNNCKTNHFISENEENELVEFTWNKLYTKRDFRSEFLISSPNK